MHIIMLNQLSLVNGIFKFNNYYNNFCSEENNSIPDVGVDMLLRDGKLDNLKNGPLYWVDISDSQPFWELHQLLCGH